MMKFSELKETMRSAMIEGTVKADTLVATRVKPQVDTIVRQKGGRFAIKSFLVLGMCLSLSTVAFADDAMGGDIKGRIDDASTQILSFLQGILLSIGAVSLAVCGIVLLLGLGGQRASENAKSWAIRIFFGMAIVLMAKPIVEWVMSLMPSGTN